MTMRAIFHVQVREDVERDHDFYSYCKLNLVGQARSSGRLRPCPLFDFVATANFSCSVRGQVTMSPWCRMLDGSLA